MSKVSYMKRSPITGRKYDYFGDDVIRLLNFRQSFFYIEEMGVVPLDIVLSDDRKRQGKKVVLFLFSKEETREAYDAWCKKEHEEEVSV